MNYLGFEIAEEREHNKSVRCKYSEGDPKGEAAHEEVREL